MKAIVRLASVTLTGGALSLAMLLGGTVPTAQAAISTPHTQPIPQERSAAGTMTRHTQFVADQIGPRFRLTPCGSMTGPDQTGGDPATGNGLDCAVGVQGEVPTAAERAEMRELAQWAVQHASTLKVADVMFDQQIFVVGQPEHGWREMPDRGSVTANQVDHVHISIQNPDSAPEVGTILGWGWT